MRASRRVVAAMAAVATMVVGGVVQGPVARAATPAYQRATAVSAGGDHSLVLRADRSVWAFGSNQYGQLGSIGDNTAAPRPVTGISDATAVAAGAAFSLVLRADGTVWAFGANTVGQLGTTANNGTEFRSPTATQVPGLTSVTAIAAGTSHSLALRSDGTVWAFGGNRHGQLGTATGNGTDAAHPTPTQVPGLTQIVAISAGHDHSLALRSDGSVWSFGGNGFGQLGRATNTGSETANPVPTAVAGITGTVTSIDAGAGFSLARTSDGKVWAFGATFTGQLGDGGGGTGIYDGNSTPTLVPNQAGVASISAGGEGLAQVTASRGHALAARADGTVWTWGDNLGGQLGNDFVGFVSSAQPQGGYALGGITSATAVSAGGRHSLVLLSDGVVLSVGSNESGQLGAATNAGLAGVKTTSLVRVLFGDEDFADDGVRAAESTTELVVAGRGGVPVNAVAAVLNVTVDQAQDAGFVTVWPCGQAQPTASNLNFAAGQTTSNAVVAKIGAGGKVCLFTHSRTHLVVDVNGYFPSGTYQALTPARLMDSRADGVTVDGNFRAGGARAAGSTTELAVSSRGGVAADAAAVVLNVAVTEPTADGFLSVRSCAQSAQTSSSLNYAAGQTTSNLVIVTLDGPTVPVCVFTKSGTHLVVDVEGSFPAGSDFRSLLPVRLLETRSGESTVDGQANGIGTRAAGTVTEVLVAGRGGVPAGADSAVLNVAVTGATGAGFLTVWPCGVDRPTASNLNHATGQTTSNAVLAKIGTDGKVCIYNHVATDVVVDVGGSFPVNGSYRALTPTRLLDTRGTA